jgi:hypothetical protein
MIEEQIRRLAIEHGMDEHVVIEIARAEQGALYHIIDSQKREPDDG